jgi:fluoride exporter
MAAREHPTGAAPGRLHAAVFAGGSVGALARVGLVELLPRDLDSWPWATFVANLAGTFVLGVVAARWRAPSSVRLALLGAGFCGALTTFSTLQIELIELVRHGRTALAAGYLVASLGAGLALVHLPMRRLRTG